MRAHDLRQVAPGIWSNGHIRFDPAPARSGKASFDIRLASTDDGAVPVGHLRWNSAWKEYVLLTRDGYVFAHDCLGDIARLLRHLTGGVNDL